MSGPKPNRCELLFRCSGCHDKCVYSKIGEDEWCIYYEWGKCISAVANVNAMTVRLKELGVK